MRNPKPVAGVSEAGSFRFAALGTYWTQRQKNKERAVALGYFMRIN